MLSKDNYKYITSDMSQFEFTCNSADEKPVGAYEGRKIAVGSTLLEWDTGDIYRYDDGKWEKLGGGAG